MLDILFGSGLNVLTEGSLLFHQPSQGAVVAANTSLKKLTGFILKVCDIQLTELSERILNPSFHLRGNLGFDIKDLSSHSVLGHNNVGIQVINQERRELLASHLPFAD